MSRVGRRRLWAIWCVLVSVWPAPLLAQDEPAAPDDALEAYLTERGLDELLATYLLERLKKAEGPARVQLAERLGSLYVRLFDKARSPDERQLWETRSQELLRTVPEAESFEVRLNLAKARYLQAETIAENYRLRLASPEERQEAERVMRTVGATFQDIGAKMNRRVDQLEKREASGREQDEAALREELAEARRLRSLAMYYAGWSTYYAAFLAGKPAPDEALVFFGWLLNAAGGRQANVERVPANLLRYEHVARAAIGCALSESTRGRDGAALLWLEAVQNAEGVPPAVTGQLFARRLAIWAAARRWSDIEYAIKRRRTAEPDQPPKPLDVAEARLLAVLTLEALQNESTTPVARDLIQRLADTAMTDLVTLGKVQQVQDLVTRYGSAQLGGEGFIVQYVRGMQAYDRAREAHQAAGNAEEPTADAAVKNLYREAAASLDIALKQPDSERFQDQKANAGLVLGLALYYADDLTAAADRFEALHQSAPAAKQAEDALWLAIVSLDRAIEAGRVSLRTRLQALGTLFLERYPKTERAARLLLRRSGADMVSGEKAVEVLLGVPRDSALYESARRQAASLLYVMYRGASSADKDFAALRFAEISDELLRIDGRRLIDAPKSEREEVAKQLVVRARQLLDVVLGMSVPDLARADRAFQLLDSLAADHGLDLSKVEDELTYRRLQAALIRSRTDEVNRHLDRLHALGGRFAEAADRLMYRRALSLLALPNAPPNAPDEVVRHGQRVMAQFGRDAAALRDPAVYSLHNAVADAAARIWRARKDESMRDLALEIDHGLVMLGNPPIAVLRRYAEISEAAGKRDMAMEAWRLLLAGTNRTAPDWFEARYHSLRLLFEVDPPRAREAMDQFKVLYPDFGPEPWNELLRDLDTRMPPAPAPAQAPGEKP